MFILVRYMSDVSLITLVSIVPISSSIISRQMSVFSIYSFKLSPSIVTCDCTLLTLALHQMPARICLKTQTMEIQMNCQLMWHVSKLHLLPSFLCHQSLPSPFIFINIQKTNTYWEELIFHISLLDKNLVASSVCPLTQQPRPSMSKIGSRQMLPLSLNLRAAKYPH